jgi:hypothetical protein
MGHLLNQMGRRLESFVDEEHPSVSLDDCYAVHGELLDMTVRHSLECRVGPVNNFFSLRE